MRYAETYSDLVLWLQEQCIPPEQAQRWVVEVERKRKYHRGWRDRKLAKDPGWDQRRSATRRKQIKTGRDLDREALVWLKEMRKS